MSQSQVAMELSSALIKFYSKEEVSRHLKALIEVYQKQVDQHGDKLGALLRVNPQTAKAEKVEKVEKTEKGGKKEKIPEGKVKVASKNWVKMGTMLFNVSDPVAGNTEVMFQIHEEMKQKLARAAEALKSFEEASGSIIPEGAAYLLYVRNGIPERLLVDALEKKSGSFSFQGRFKVV